MIVNDDVIGCKNSAKILIVSQGSGGFKVI